LVYALYGIFFLSCIVLIAVVLLQPGKTDAGALFTSNISSAAFAPRGTASVLSKMTIASAVIFLVTALFLSMPALTGDVSVLQSVSETPAEAPAEQPAAAPDTNANASAPETTTNSNGALVETPATTEFKQDAANANAANSAPANK
jgi:preprotein translocase subunit SecG